MDIGQTIKNKAIDIAKGITRIGVLPYGQQFKRDLGLNNFEFVWVQKILGLPFNIYIVTLDSKHPDRYIPMMTVKNSKSLVIKRLKNFRDIYKFKGFKTTPPVQIDDFNKQVESGSIILMHDLAGEWFNNITMFEKVLSDNTKVMLS